MDHFQSGDHVHMCVKDIYPDYLNPFQVDAYLNEYNPFSDSEDDERDRRIFLNSYPRDLNPFSDSEDEQDNETSSYSENDVYLELKKSLKISADDYPCHLNPFGDDEVKMAPTPDKHADEKIVKKKTKRAPQPPQSHWDPDGYMALFCRGQ